RRTTRDEPDYDRLMNYRLNILDQRGLKLSDIQGVIGSLRPLEGALDFLRELRAITQVIILSDTFEQFAKPLLRQLEWPTLLCHCLEVENDRIINYKLRIPEQKQRAVAALKSLNYHVIAAGDSFNDTAMLGEAHVGFLFRAPLFYLGLARNTSVWFGLLRGKSRRDESRKWKSRGRRRLAPQEIFKGAERCGKVRRPGGGRGEVDGERTAGFLLPMVTNGDQ